MDERQEGKGKEAEGRRVSYKFRLYPTKEQEAYFVRNFGCCRYVYNYFLAARISAYEKTRKTLKRMKVDGEGNPVVEDGRKIWEEIPNPDYDASAKPMSFYDTSKALTDLKKTTRDEEGRRWLYEADATALVYALRHLDTAYKNFFRRVKKGGKPGFPRFKRRSDGRQSFTVAKCRVEEGGVIFSKIGRVKARIHREVEGSIVSATVSRDPAGRYHVSINVKDAPPCRLVPSDAAVGITLGLERWCVTSDGEVFENPGPGKKMAKKLAREQRRLARKVPGSSNYAKQKARVARVNAKIADRRSYETHAMTRQIVDSYGMIATRTMDVESMLQKESKATEKMPKRARRSLNRALADANFSEVNRQLAYKSEWAGRTFVELPAETPTAQICSKCGDKNEEVAYSFRQSWTCPQCGAVHDRKYNGALNVLEEGMKMLTVGEEEPC